MRVKISRVIRPIEMLQNRETQIGKIYDGETFKVSGNWASIVFFHRESGLDDFLSVGTEAR